MDFHFGAGLQESRQETLPWGTLCVRQFGSLPEAKSKKKKMKKNLQSKKKKRRKRGKGLKVGVGEGKVKWEDGL